MLIMLVYPSNNILIVNVKADDPPNDDPEAYFYEYFTPPDDSFGLGETVFKDINRSLLKQKIKNNCDWALQVRNPQTGEWVNITQRLNIHLNWSNLTNSYKITMNFTTLDQGVNLDYRIALLFKTRVKNFVNKTGEHEVTFEIPANKTEWYNLSFNWSDMLQYSGLIFNHGKKNIGGEDFFYFIVRRNNIPPDFYVELDPTFGNKKNVKPVYSFYSNSLNEYADVNSNKPKLNLGRWQKECWVNVSYPDYDNGIFYIDFDDSKLKWVGDKIDYHVYPLANNTWEYEIILKEKPDSNILNLSIDTKGLDFFYQPPLYEVLNVSEYDFVNETHAIQNGYVIVHRPIDVVGSYAVYHSSKRDNKYKVGKAFHIYRPKIIDSDGWEVWGNLSIDAINGTQTVTIPQVFIDNAVYPIHHACGETFGYTGETFSTIGLVKCWATDKECNRRGRTYTLSEEGTLDSIHVWLKIDSADSLDMTVFVNREDSEGSGSHGEVVSIEDTVSLGTSFSWEVFSASSELLSADDYILNIIGDPRDLTASNYARMGWDSTDNDNIYHELWENSGTEYADAQESPWTEVASSTGLRLSIYCTYTPGGSNTAPTITGEIPANTSTDISLSPTCNVTVNDADSDTMDVTFATNESGSWLNKQTNSSVSTGTSVEWVFSDADTGSTKYWWRVYCDDDTVNISETYYFTTGLSIDAEVSPTTWNEGNIALGTSITENFTFWQNGTSNIDVTIGVNKTNFTFVTYSDWVSLGHDRYCANFTTDSWSTESNIAVGYPPTSVLKSDYSPGDFEFGIRIWMPRTVTYNNKREDYKIVLTVSEST